MPEPEKRHSTSTQYHQEPFFSRAARLLYFGKPEPAGRQRELSHSTDKSLSEKPGLDTIAESSGPSGSSPSKDSTSITSNALKENIDRRRHVRTLPPWIHSLREDETLKHHEDISTAVSQPSKIKSPHRNHMPQPKHEPKLHAARGRAWDHARSCEAVTTRISPTDHGSRWHEFVGSSSYGQPKSEEGEIVDDDWIKENIPDLNQPYVSATRLSEAEKDERLWLLSEKKRSATFIHFQNILMKNPFVPLVIRLTVMAFCLVALGLGVQIWRRSRSLNTSRSHRQDTTQVSSTTGDYICKQQASTYMAFIVDSFAIVYLLYITYDEYFSKPLGLRSSKEKIRLLFLDLWFIIFSAANLSLAFNTLTDQQWSCFEGMPNELNLNNAEAARSTCVRSEYLCQRQKGLVTVLLIAELAWVMTFSISTLRVVERIER